MRWTSWSVDSILPADRLGPQIPTLHSLCSLGPKSEGSPEPMETIVVLVGVVAPRGVGLVNAVVVAGL